MPEVPDVSAESNQPELSQPKIDSDRQDPFSNQIVGWTFLISAVLLLGFVGYFVFVVTQTLIRPTPLFETLSENYIKELTDKPSSDEDAKKVKDTSGGSKVDKDKNTVNLVVILEYANADIRTASVQVAFALVGGLFFATLGILMFAAGAAGAITMGGKTKGMQFRLATGAPGLVSIILGGVILAFGVAKDVSRPLRAEVSRPMGINVDSETFMPRSTPIGEVNKDGKNIEH